MTSDPTTFVTKDARRLCISLSTSIMQGRDDVLHGIVCIARDITERKRAEEEKQRIVEQLNLAGRLAAIRELAAGAAHELNNPLAAIQGFAQLLKSGNNLDETTKKDLETIYREALIAGDSSKRQREAGYYSNMTYRHPYQIHLSDEEAFEAFMKVPRGQWDSGVMDSFLQILGRQVMMSQVPTLVET